MIPLPSRNSDIVRVGQYGIDATYPNTYPLGPMPAGVFEIFNYYQRSRIRQTGNLLRIKFNLDSVTNLTSIKWRFWRQYESSGTYAPPYLFRKIGETEELISLVSVGINDITLSVPVPLWEGDFFSIRCVSTSGATVYMHLANRTSGGGSQQVPKLYYVTTDITQDYDWLGPSVLENYLADTEFYMQAPHYVVFGDSLSDGVVPGRIVSRGLADLYDGFIPGTIWPFMLYEATNYKGTYQVLGIGGQTSASCLARFSNDVVALHPAECWMIVGHNDIHYATNTLAEYIADITSMLDQAVTAGIVMRMFTIPPSTWMSNAMCQERDARNAALITLFQSYPQFTLFHVDSLMGQFRAGGDTNNLWDLNADFEGGDGIHFPFSAGFVLRKWLDDNIGVTGSFGLMKNTALNNFTFVMGHATDAVTCHRGLDGGAEAAMSNSASSVGNKLWKINVSNVDNNADAGYFRFSQTGQNDTILIWRTQPFYKNTAQSNFYFTMGASGLTVSANRTIDGAAETACANSVTEVGNKIYRINLAAADTNGDVITYRFSATAQTDKVVTVKTQ